MEKNILIVDDCKTTRSIIGLYLKSAGFKTVMAENGFDAVEKLMNNHVDFIITDLNMPQMDGIELTKWVRNNSGFQDIPLIILTTEDDKISKTKGMDNGASAFLTKPISKDKLINEIKNLVEWVKGG